MQTFGLHKNLYKLADYSLRQESRSHTQAILAKAIGDWDQLKADNVPDKHIAQITGISRATYYRRKAKIKRLGAQGFDNDSRRPKTLRQSKVPQSTIDLVLKIRQENPTYGKAKIAVILKRDHQVSPSESTVGRIIKTLVAQGKVQPSLSRVYKRKKRRFKGHAQKFQYGMKGKVPGEMVQIDHMTTTVNGCTVKHFQAWDPITKIMVTQVFSNATSSSAAKFLKKVIEDMPFEVQSIQVDGGSEFMGDFEEFAQTESKALYVLPPRRPQYNGGVERGNRTFKEEFYAQQHKLSDSVRGINAELQEASHKYNHYRPHFRLHGLTPYEKYANLSSAA